MLEYSVRFTFTTIFLALKRVGFAIILQINTVKVTDIKIFFPDFWGRVFCLLIQPALFSVLHFIIGPFLVEHKIKRMRRVEMFRGTKKIIFIPQKSILLFLNINICQDKKTQTFCPPFSAPKRWLSYLRSIYSCCRDKYLHSDTSFGTKCGFKTVKQISFVPSSS